MMKLALKSKINTSCGKSYRFGEPVWFKLESSHKWKSGVVLGQDGKVIFIKYANFIRRVPLDFIIPADEYSEENDEANQEDIHNSERLDDDQFDNVDVIAKKDKEIEELKKSMMGQADAIKSLEVKISENNEASKQTEIKNLQNLYQKIEFTDNKTGNIIRGKVLRKHQPKSIHKNTLGMKLDNGTEKNFDFVKDVEEWIDVRDLSDNNEDPEPCCLY